jgi:hypothetical protein
MNELRATFSKVKNRLYKLNFSTFDISDLIKAVESSTETAKLKAVRDEIEIMEKSFQDLGTEILWINSKEFEVGNRAVIAELMKDLIRDIDQCVDSFVMIIKLVDYDEKITLKKSAAYMKALRGHLVSKINEFKIRLLQGPTELQTFKRILNDAIDSFVREFYSMQFLKLRAAIDKKLK